MEAGIECADANGGALEGALNGAVEAGAAGGEAFACVGEGLARVVLEDGGGKEGKMALAVG